MQEFRRPSLTPCISCFELNDRRAVCAAVTDFLIKYVTNHIVVLSRISLFSHGTLLKVFKYPIIEIGSTWSKRIQVQLKLLEDRALGDNMVT